VELELGQLELELELELDGARLESGVIVLPSLLLPETDLEDHQTIPDHGAE